jgi:CRP/FNR family nitrogen fixation transcriptional regulator
VPDFRGTLTKWTMTAGDLRRAENHILLLGCKTAMEKVATFLLEMDRRLAKTGTMALPMCRRDISDYPGLTLETVSRAFTTQRLRHSGVFERPVDHVAQSPAPG